jgi:hypothetical protein
VLRGKTNNAMRYNFAGGDPMTGKAASIMLKSQYAQNLLESSDIFRNGLVRLVRTDDGGETPIEVKKTVIDDVVSPEQLLEFVNLNLEPTNIYKSPKYALKFAETKGYSFPNLKLEKEEE